jgi:hypothetical protein
MENPPRVTPSSKDHPSNLLRVLDALEELYGPQRLAGPTDPYEMILFVNCGYPAADTSCAKGFDALKREVGLKPNEILAASKPKLAKLMRLGGIVPELRADRLKEIASSVKDEFGGDLKAILRKSLQEEKRQPGKGIRAAKKSASAVPRDRRTQRRKNPIVLKAVARRGGPLSSSRRAYPALVRRARQELRGGLLQGAEFLERQTARQF